MDITEINKASGLDLFEGDILGNPMARNTIIGAQYRWPLTVPYYMEDSLGINAKGVILKAFERFRLKTCIDFKPWSGETNYVSVFNGLGCYSYIGNLRGGKQQLSIGNGCDTVEIVQHEFLHALGFFHEQSRSDRDDYVTIDWENIIAGSASNFYFYDDSVVSSLNVPYDYTSVMHYGKSAFSTGYDTIVPKYAQFTNIIGRQMDFSDKDVLKLNRLYNCTSSITFLDSCNFESDEMCAMVQRSDDKRNWERVTLASSGPYSDHSIMQSGKGYFALFSTSTGNAGDDAVLESRLFYPTRGYQCLEFFYYHSGSDDDQLNIWIKEYTTNSTNGTLRSIDAIQGKPADYWQLHYSSFNATHKFRFVFQGIKGHGNSSGGISIDDINLSQTKCPQNIWHIRNFTENITAQELYSPPFYSQDGYAYQISLYSYATADSPYNLATYLYLISGANDNSLKWPCLWKQATVEFLDQNPDAQQRTSNMKSITTDDSLYSTNYFWDKPALIGWLKTFPNGTIYNSTDGRGVYLFSSADWLYRRDFLKGGDAFILVSMEDISSLRTSQPLPSTTTSTSSSSSSNQSPSLRSTSKSANQTTFPTSVRCSQTICYNGGTCVVENQMEVCRCLSLVDVWYGGANCELIFHNRAYMWTTSIFTTLLTAVLTGSIVTW
ncbi:meprin A subunit beta-like [Hyperolius riggenbachi]|uniref:meprin A subunit beta-like n=1 Tax=Hyperolius riggenbachi TaxID=752182 RepID=UPI0035A317F4